MRKLGRGVLKDRKKAFEKEQKNLEDLSEKGLKGKNNICKDR